ncbi:hypothetical protein D3C75_838720 [compost metagenome]
MRSFFNHSAFLFILLPDDILVKIRVVLLYNRIFHDKPNLIQHRSSFFQRLVGDIRHSDFGNHQLGVHIPDHTAHSKQ